MSHLKKVVGTISEGLNIGEFDWTINVCSDAILKRIDPVISPTFYFSSSSWHILMKHYTDSSKKDYMSIYLSKEDFEVPSYVSFSAIMIFFGEEVQIEFEGDQPDCYCEKTNEWGWPDFIPKKQLLNHWTKTSKFCCGELIIRIKMRDYVPRDEDRFCEIRLKGKELLRQNYKNMLVDGNDHDLVIKVKDKEFKAHRNIMQSRCPVFKSMLSHEMLEKNSGIVDIPDCDPVAFEQFLLYIYTGELDEVLDVSTSTMLGLYFIADKYDMEYLKEECCAFIKEYLSDHVVCDVIKLALDHSDSALLEFATKYFVSNAKDILITEEWMSFNKAYPIQANELMIKVLDKTSFCCVRRSEDSVSDLENN